MASDPLSLEIILVEKVLKVALSKDPMRASASGFRYDVVALPNVNLELSRFRHSSLMDDPSFVDNIIIERFSLPQTTILSLGSESFYIARSESQKNINMSNPRAQKLLGYLQDILINFTALGIYQSEMFPNQFPQCPLSGTQLGAFRVLDFLEHGGSKDFLVLLMQYWNREDPGFCEELLISLQTQMNMKVKRMNLLDDPSVLTGILKDLFEIKAVPPVLIRDFLINESWNGAEIEMNSLFGGYLSPGLFPKPGYFAKIPGMPGPPDPVREKVGGEFRSIKYMVDYRRAIEKYSNMYKGYAMVTTAVFKALLKEDRKKAMDWLISSVVSSAGKAKLGNRIGAGNAQTCPGDNYCINLFDILLQISLPFLNPDDERVKKISETYMVSNAQMLKIQDTPLCNKIEKLSVPLAESGTITEFYFSCCLMFHYSWHTAWNFINDIHRVLSRLEKKTSPADKKDFEYYSEIRYCFETIVIDPHRNSLILKLSSLTINLILKWAGYNGTLPLPPPSPILSIIPEYFLEDISEFLVSMQEMKTEILDSMSSAQISDLATVITVITNSPEHFTNPYMRAKFVKSFSLLLKGKKSGEINSIIDRHSLFQRFFMQGLVKFYVEIEFGGGHTQFYDKFEYRHYAWKIFEYLWVHPLYQNNTRALENEEYFKKFVNYILNDVNYCLQEGIDQLMKIKKLKSKNSELTPEEQEDLTKATGFCKYMMQQSHECISMLKLLSDWNSPLFISEEFGERTAAILNNYLKMLCGPKCLDIKVDNPAEYNFRPEQLLCDLLKIYLNISRHPEFFECIIKDERSFSLDVYNKALNICMKKPILGYDEKLNFKKFISQVQEYDGNRWQPELEDIPEEFLCAISYDLMKNPVKLPSGTIVDKVSIVRHLLSDENDPFNRQPLKAADLVEDFELKARIDAWVESQKKAKYEKMELE